MHLRFVLVQQLAELTRQEWVLFGTLVNSIKWFETSLVAELFVSDAHFILHKVDWVHVVRGTANTNGSQVLFDLNIELLLHELHVENFLLEFMDIVFVLVFVSQTS